MAINSIPEIGSVLRNTIVFNFNSHLEGAPGGVGVGAFSSTLRNLAGLNPPANPIRLLRNGYPTSLGRRVQLEKIWSDILIL